MTKIDRAGLADELEKAIDAVVFSAGVHEGTYESSRFYYYPTDPVKALVRILSDGGVLAYLRTTTEAQGFLAPVTVSRLDEAIANILGAEIVQALKQGHVGRSRLHSMAIEKAFLADRRDEDVAVLRLMGRELSRTGYYPKEAWDVED